MKKLLLTFFIIICTIFSQAQDYKITFSLTGEINEIDSVIVENASKQTSVKLNGTDTLILTKVVSSFHQLENNNSLQLKAFPNPSSTSFSIQFSTNKSEPVFTSVYDLGGRKLISKKWDVPMGIHSFKLKNLPMGIFLVQLNTSQNSDRLKIISLRNKGSFPEINSFQTKQINEMILPTKSATSAQLLGYEEYDNITVRVWPSDPFITRGSITQGIVMDEEEPPLENEQSTFVFEYVKCEDACGNVYNTVELGDQIWMAENFRCATENSWVYNDDENNAETYGRLYTWEDALNNAPMGWHLPSNEEWNKMQEYVKNTYDDNLPVALKSKSGWNPDEFQNSSNGTDASGFNIVPAGARWFADGTFYAAGDRAYFWTATEYDSERARMRKFTSSDTEIGEGASNVEYGFSVRYIKDSQTSGYATFTDSRDDKSYKMVTIGEQIWMAENLAFLPDVSPPEQQSETLPNYYVYGYNGTDISEAVKLENYSNYGVIYNWNAANSVCPSGWHLPSDDEWMELADYLGGLGVAGSKLKETGNEHWAEPNTDADNSSGFTALPGGFLDAFAAEEPYFKSINEDGYWWSSTSYQDEYRYAGIHFNNTSINRYSIKSDYGLSVRCIKD